ncbi:unnamed protein product, partial [Adineta steineri]
VKITIYEGRWYTDENGIMRWRDKEQGNRRRDQVVSLQDHVIQQLPKYIRQGLFKNIDERVWPKSRNIPIREVEDRLFELIQPFVQTGQIKLVAERLEKETECIRQGCFDVLVGADGLESFVRKYSEIPLISEGTENACGVAFNIPKDIPLTEEPLPQALNCILTTSQTRFLVNSSYSRSGYLNIRLIEGEFLELNKYLQKCKDENKPWNIPDYNKELPSSPLWNVVREGLEYFKIPPQYVINIAPIKINVCYTSVVVRELRLDLPEEPNENCYENQNKKYKIVLVCLMGDAAMDVHFWSGRGMNTGMKSAIALARNIVRSCLSKSSSGETLLSTRCPYLHFLDYEGFMARLRARELQGRSLDVLIIPIDDCVIKAYFHTYLTQAHGGYVRKLIEKLKRTRDALEKLPDWPHRNRPVTDEELEGVAKRISPLAITQLAMADASLPRELSDIEILIEDTFPFDSHDYLPLPKSRFNKILKESILNKTSEKSTSHTILENASSIRILEKQTSRTILENPSSIRILEKPTSNRVLEEPLFTKISEKPISNRILEKPTSHTIIENPSSNKISEKPTTNRVLEKPTTNRVLEKSTSNRVLEKSTSNKISEKSTSNRTLEKTTSNRIPIHHHIQPVIIDTWPINNMDDGQISTEHNYYPIVSPRTPSRRKKFISNYMPSNGTTEIVYSNMPILSEINTIEVPIESTYPFYQQNYSNSSTHSNRVVTPWADFYIYQ